jgi:hypothetical protein
MQRSAFCVPPDHPPPTPWFGTNDLNDPNHPNDLNHKRKTINHKPETRNQQLKEDTTVEDERLRRLHKEGIRLMAKGYA